MNYSNLHSSIRQAIERDDEEVLSRLLDEHLANLSGSEAPDALMGTRWLHTVGYEGRSNLIPVLLKRGFSLSRLNDADCPPLLHAIKKNQLATAEAFLDYGADPTMRWVQPQGGDETALHLAATKQGAASLIRRLVGLGLDVDSRMPDDLTPLCVAAEHGICDNIRTLLALGANPHHRTSEGLTPLEMARFRREAAHLIRAWISAHEADQAMDDAVKDASQKGGLTPLGFCIGHASSTTRPEGAGL